MISSHTFFRRSAVVLLLSLTCGTTALQAQDVRRAQPTWWVGAAGAANFNFYHGTSQVLNENLTTPAPFHEGFGVGYYAGLLAEFRPNHVVGYSLNVGFDERSGAFDEVKSACGCNGYLSTTLRYISVTPSLRIAPFGSAFYLFIGPRIAFNLEKAFTFEQEGKPGFIVDGEFDRVRTTLVSGEVGAGVDIPLTRSNAPMQVAFSPFVSFQPYFGQDPRSDDMWHMTTLRVGAALKFGRGKELGPEAVASDPVRTPVPARDVTFSVRAPRAVPVEHRVRETFPLRNYVFFEAGSSEIPSRYRRLTASQASGFKEEQLQSVEPESMVGRSGRQMAVYYNILNILGDRLRSNPGSSVTLVGSSGGGATDGLDLAESVKRYLVTAFGLSASSIATEGRVKPRIPSEQPSLTRELALRTAEDRRVDIESRSPELLLQVGGPPDILRPVQIVAVMEDPLDSHVVFTVDSARESLSSWSLELTDPQSVVQRFGPFTRDQESIPGKTILGSRTSGDFRVVMVGQTKNGRSITKESSVRLALLDSPAPEMLRFSILLDFDKARTIASYEDFLTKTVAPLVPAGGKVIVHGHTDIVGDVGYNDTLSRARADDVQRILQRALSSLGTRGVTFETYGFGEDFRYAPFENGRPEERFYNRTVIIDVVPEG